MKRALFLLYGDVDFDGRARRMQDIVAKVAGVHLLDAATRPGEQDARRTRIILSPQSGIIRRHLAFWVGAIRKARQLKPDVIIAENFFSCLPAWMAARLTGARLVYDAYELIIPEARRKLGWRSWLWYRFERFVVPKCDYVIAANPERAELMQQHYRLSQTPDYMRNIPEHRPVSPEESEAALQRHPALRRRSSADRILLYQGDISMERGLDRFVEVLTHLPEEWRLVVIGNGPDLEKLKAMARPWQDKGRFDALGRIPSQDLPALTRHGDVGIVTYPFTGLNNIYCAPNKIYEYMMAGLPVIASSQPTIQAILGETGYGITYDPAERAPDIARKITAVFGFGSPRTDMINHIVQADRCRRERDIRESIGALFG